MMKKEKTPLGIRQLTWSTSVRWFGWGLGEAFMPIFLLLFSASFLETGFLASIYHVVFFLSIPFAGYLADNIKIKKMVLAGLVIYVFIGLGYFLAGLTGAVIFVILARGLNGISYSLDQVGRESYFIRNSSKDKVSSIFGRFRMVANFWWIFAVIIGLLLVKFMSVPIHWLLFFIAPTSIISFFIVLKLKEKEKNKKKVLLSKAYTNLFKNIKNFSSGLKIILLFSFMTGILSSIIYFFVPISAYIHGDGLVNAAILALVYAIPSLFGKVLGEVADKKRESIYLASFFFLILILVSLMFTQNYFLLMLIMFASSLIFELMSLTNKGMMARFADRTHLGETDGSLNGIAALGAIIGPVLFGFLLDSISKFNAYLIISFIPLIALAVSFFGAKKYLKTK